MKVTLISPEFPFSGRVPMVPPILEYLGAITLRESPEARLQLLDANQRRVTPADVEGDLVGLSVWTATAPWAYRFADACRAAGKRVVLGGIHASALPDEAAQHADAVVVGEAESCWGELLRDAAAGSLKRRYDGLQLPLSGLAQPLDARLKGNYQFRAFFTMRGCPYSCTFCSVHQFFGKTVRYRPIPEVVAEIEARAGRIWFNGDDNIWGADPDRATALFDALAAGTRRSWYGFGDLRSMQSGAGERMLAAARRSGLFSVWVGWESDSPEALTEYRAGGKQGTDRIETVKRIQGHGLEVVLFAVLGGRTDGADSFQRTLDLADRLKVGVHPVLLTPLPGTPLYEQYRPHLIPGLGWDAFTGVRAVFDHPDPAMTPLARERAYHDACRELFRPRRILRRLSGIPMKAFPGVHLLSLVAQLPMKRALRLAREEWMARHAEPAAQGAGESGAWTPVAGLVWAIRDALAGAAAAVTVAAASVHQLGAEIAASEPLPRLASLEEAMEGAGWGLVAAAAAVTGIGYALARRLRRLGSMGDHAPGRPRRRAADLAVLVVIAAALAIVDMH